MTKPYTYETSATYRRIEKVLRQGTRTIADVSLAACTAQRHAARIVQHMHDKGYCHIARWITGNRGPMVPVYRWGPGQDAVKPEPLSAAAKCRRYRLAMKEKFGTEYPLVYEAQKKRVPGRQVVVGGKVIYQQ